MITVFMRHAKNFVSKDMARPVFRGIIFDGEHAIATDTHICVGVPFKSEKQIVNYRYGYKIEGTPPDIYKVIPTNIKCTATIDKTNLPFIIKALKTIKAMYKGYENNDIIDFAKSSIKARIKNDYSSSYEADFSEYLDGQFNPLMSCKNHYLLDVLSFFNDLSAKDAQKIIFSFPIESNLPVKIIAGEASALIAPVHHISNSQQ